MKILICGDPSEQLAEEIKKLPEMCGEWAVQPVTPEELKRMLPEKLVLVPVMLLVLDTEREIELAKWINKVSPVCQLVFVGKDYQLLSRVYETKHAFFLTWDQVSMDIKRALQCALRNYDSLCGRALIPLYCKGVKHFILPEDIVYAEVLGRILSIHTIQGDIYKTNCSLKRFCEKLPSWFIRTHNSYVVNRRQVLSFTYPECILRNGEKIPVSRHYRSGVDRKLETESGQLA